MTVVELKSTDHNQIFDFLLGVVKNGMVPGFSVDGKPEKDLVKLARYLPREKDLSPRHQSAVGEIFLKPQSGYFMTGVNLAHRHNQRASDIRRKATLIGMMEEQSRERYDRERTATLAGKTAN